MGPPQSTFRQKVQPLDLTPLVRDLAFELIGTDRGRDFWMNQPNTEFEGKSPQELIDDGRGEIVEHFLCAALVGEYG